MIPVLMFGCPDSYNYREHRTLPASSIVIYTRYTHAHHAAHAKHMERSKLRSSKRSWDDTVLSFFSLSIHVNCKTHNLETICCYTIPDLFWHIIRVLCNYYCTILYIIGLYDMLYSAVHLTKWCNVVNLRFLTRLNMYLLCFLYIDI